jgi:hypothetical protein
MFETEFLLQALPHDPQQTLPLCHLKMKPTTAPITIGYLPRAAVMLAVQIRASDGKGTFTPLV